MQNNDVYDFLQKTMDTLMLKHWGIILIENNKPIFVENASNFNVDNSIFENIGSHKATVIAIAVPYLLTSDHNRPNDHYGKVENFAWDFDYHIEVKGLLIKILEQLKCHFSEHFQNHEICVDNSPYNDREVGYYAGFGSVGKNHLLIHPQLGTHFFIGYLVIKGHLLFDRMPSHQLIGASEYIGCHTCERCVVACPSKVCSFEKVDMKKCLSALTQTKEWIDDADRKIFNNRIYGCSICQEVCPSNFENKSEFLLSSQTSSWLELFELLALKSSEFKIKYGNMGFAWRSLWVYKRNALIVLSGTKNKVVLQRLCTLSYLERDERLGEYYKWAINRLCISTADR